MYREFDAAGLNVINQAHDRNQTINNKIRSRDGTNNSNDRWHATKAIPATVKKIGSGAKKNEGKNMVPRIG